MSGHDSYRIYRRPFAGLAVEHHRNAGRPLAVRHEAV